MHQIYVVLMTCYTVCFIALLYQLFRFFDFHVPGGEADYPVMAYVIVTAIMIISALADYFVHKRMS